MFTNRINLSSKSSSSSSSSSREMLWHRRIFYLVSDKTIHHVNRIIINFTSRFCGIELYSERTRKGKKLQNSERPSVANNSTQFNPDISGKKNCSKYYLWPKIILLMYILAMAHLVINMSCQYKYDAVMFRMNHYMRVASFEPNGSSVWMNKISQLDERVQFYRNILHYIGSPYIHLRFSIQVIYLACMCTALLFYLLSQYLFRNHLKFDARCIRILLDHDKEMESMRKLVKEHVDLYLSSNGETWTDHSIANLSNFRFRLRRYWAPENNKDSVQKGHRLRTSRQLRQFFTEGSLTPYNFRTGWTGNLARAYFFTSSYWSFYAACFNVILFSVVHNLIDPTRESLSYADRMLIISLASVMTVNNVCSLFYVPIQLFICADQIYLSHEIRKLIDNTIKANTLIFEGLKEDEAPIKSIFTISKMINMRRPSRENEPSMIIKFNPLRNVKLGQKTHISNQRAHEQMNANLLLVLIHYRISISQVKSVRDFATFVASSATVVFFLYPMIGRAHMPYLDPCNDATIRKFIVILSIAIIVPADMCILPVCIMHAKCVHLYESLYRLLAHTIKIQSDPLGCLLYDNHIVTMLRRELDRPQKVSSQLASNFAPISFNYETLVRLHFYFGLIIISIIVESQSSFLMSQYNLASSSIFSDPFGLLND